MVARSTSLFFFHDFLNSVSHIVLAIRSVRSGLRETDQPVTEHGTADCFGESCVSEYGPLIRKIVNFLIAELVRFEDISPAVGHADIGALCRMGKASNCVRNSSLKLVLAQKIEIMLVTICYEAFEIIQIIERQKLSCLPHLTRLSAPEPALLRADIIARTRCTH